MHVSGFYSCPSLQQQLPAFLDKLREEASNNSCKLTVSLDTNGDASDLWDCGVARVLERVDFFLPNEVEASGIARRLMDKSEDGSDQLLELERAAQCLAGKVQDAVVITCGKEGCIAQTRAGAGASAPPTRWSAPSGIVPVDATGAGKVKTPALYPHTRCCTGDAFDAGFIYSMVVSGGDKGGAED